MTDYDEPATGELPLSPHAPPPGLAKGELRGWARSRRGELMNSVPDAAERSAEVVAGLRRFDPFVRAETVLTYLPFGSEIDLSDLTSAAGKRFVVPRTAGAEQGRMSLHLLAGSILEPHRFGLLEPAADTPRVVADDVDLALVPGLLFDGSGYRLGYGKGYYDRLLPLLRPGTVLVGVVLSQLVVASLPYQRHDVRVTHLATERGVFAVAPSGALPPGTPQ